MLAVKSMYMEEQPVVKPHRLTMQNRSTIQVTGVSDVIAYDPGEIILETSAGLLLIKGAELHMNHLSLEKGETGVDGRVDSLTYSEAHGCSLDAGGIASDKTNSSNF